MRREVKPAVAVIIIVVLLVIIFLVYKFATKPRTVGEAEEIMGPPAEEEMMMPGAAEGEGGVMEGEAMEAP